MRRSTRHFVSKAAVTAVLAVCTGAGVAADGKTTGEFGWLGVGKAVEVEKGHYYWVGEFSGTFFNDKGPGSPMHHAGVKCPAWFDADYSRNVASAGGYCMITDVDGDSILCNWRNGGTPANGSRNPGTFDCRGLSGKYAGMNARNTFIGVVQLNWADGTTSGYAIWNRQ